MTGRGNNKISYNHDETITIKDTGRIASKTLSEIREENDANSIMHVTVTLISIKNN